MSPREGVWLAYYGDWSDWSVFASEIKALRYANDKSMKVMFLHFGVSAYEAVK